MYKAEYFYVSAALPNGGLLNPPGRNICFANSLLKYLRVTDIHKILQLHDQCVDSGKELSIRMTIQLNG